MIAINIPTNGGGPPIAVDGSKMPASTADSHWFVVYLFLICLSFVSSLFDRSWDLLPVSCGIPGSRGRSDHFGSCCVTFFFSPLLFYPPDAGGFDHSCTWFLSPQAIQLCQGVRFHRNQYLFSFHIPDRCSYIYINVVFS